MDRRLSIMYIVLLLISPSGCLNATESQSEDSKDIGVLEDSSIDLGNFKDLSIDSGVCEDSSIQENSCEFLSDRIATIGCNGGPCQVNADCYIRGSGLCKEINGWDPCLKSREPNANESVLKCLSKKFSNLNCPLPECSYYLSAIACCENGNCIMKSGDEADAGTCEQN